MTDERLTALQSALAGEHAALYVLSSLGAQTSESATPTLYADVLAAYDDHRDARDHLVARVAALGGTPVAAAPSYALPNAMTDAGQLRRAARLTEQRMTDVYGTLVAETVGSDRAWAITSMDDSAVRQLRFGGRPEVFPGTGGLGDRTG